MSKPIKTPPDRSISDADWEQTPDSVRRYVEKLVEKGGRNSRNSSQPPSQDKPSQKASLGETKERSTRKAGGQPGHAGTNRALLALSEVDEVVVYRPEHCRVCGSVLTGEDAAPYWHQVTEIPVVKATVTEHQVACLVCDCCGHENRGELPTSVSVSQFGPQLVSLMVLLMGVYRLSKRQVVRLLADCYGVEVAVSSVVNQQYAVSAALAAPVAAAQDYVQQQQVCNVDETRWRQRGQPKTGWLWVAVTQLVTVFQVALSRSHDVAQELLGKDYAGVVGSDRAGCYTWLSSAQRQVCWSHLLRDFQSILERAGVSFEIGTNLKLQGEYLLALWARTRADPSQRATFDTELPAIQDRIRHWLSVGAACSESQTAKTCTNLLALEPALWTFATAEGVEPTNNAAERALRHPVIWRRLSFGTHSAQGSLFVERILTTVESCRLQQRDCLAFLREAIIAHRAGLAAPSLLPDNCDPLNTYMTATDLKRLRQIVLAMLCMTGRVTMVGLSRWTEKGGGYRTLQRWFVSRVEWGALLWAVVEAHLIHAGGTYLLAVDEVVVSKAGKMTHGVGRFYSSIAGRRIGGVSFVAASLVDVGQRRSYPVQVEQRLPTPKAVAPAGEAVKRGRGRPKGNKNHAKSAPLLSAELTVLDGLLCGLLKRIGVLQVKHLVMDGFFGNYPTTWLAAQHGLHLISKLRHNAVLFFPDTGPKPRRGPIPRYGQRLDYRALSLDAHTSVVSEGRFVTEPMPSLSGTRTFPTRSTSW